MKQTLSVRMCIMYIYIKWEANFELPCWELMIGFAMHILSNTIHITNCSQSQAKRKKEVSIHKNKSFSFSSELTETLCPLKFAQIMYKFIANLKFFQLFSLKTKSQNCCFSFYFVMIKFFLFPLPCLQHILSCFLQSFFALVEKKPLKQFPSMVHLRKASFILSYF